MSAILALCGIKGPARDRLLKLTREAHEPETTVVPGLLQVPDYARALVQGAPAIPKHEVDDRVRARIRRQEIFNRNWPPRFRFFLDEYVLSRTGPGREIMSEQVHHVLRMSVRPYVEIRVILDGFGFHATHHAFHLMEFTELHPVVHVENEDPMIWRKSSFSHPNNCVELARPREAPALRDSKNPAGPVLIHERERFAHFVARLGR